MSPIQDGWPVDPSGPHPSNGEAHEEFAIAGDTVFDTQVPHFLEHTASEETPVEPGHAECKLRKPQAILVDVGASEQGQATSAVPGFKQTGVTNHHIEVRVLCED